MKHFFSPSWKSFVSLTLIVAILATSIHVDLVRMVADWFSYPDFFTAQTVPGPAAEQQSRPTGPKCLDIENFEKAFYGESQKLKTAQEENRRRQAFASENRVPVELVKKRDPVPEFKPESIDNLLPGVLEKAAAIKEAYLQKKNALTGVNQVQDVGRLNLQTLTQLLPSQPYSRADLEYLLSQLNGVFGDGVFQMSLLDEIFEKNGNAEVVFMDGKIFFVDTTLRRFGTGLPQLSFLDLSTDRTYDRFVTVGPTDYATIESLPRELREWAKQYGAVNAASRADARATGYLRDLRNVFDAYQRGATRDQRKPWTIFQIEQRQNYATFAQLRSEQGRSSLHFIINPNQQEIVMHGVHPEKGDVTLVFRHVGDNIYEYRAEDGKVYRWLITGSVTNLEQGSALFDRITSGQEPAEIVRTNADGTEWRFNGNGRLQVGDRSYTEWKSNLKAEREDEQIRTQVEQEKLRESFLAQPNQVRLRIRQLDLLLNDLIAFRTETENAVASRFAAFLRQSYATYHPLGENGLNIFSFGGSESNFKERITAMVNLFVDLYLTPKAELGNKSQLQVWLEQNPTMSLQEILMAVDRDGTGTFVSDPAMGEFIRGIFLNYSVAGFNITTHYQYKDPKSEQDLLTSQLDQLKLLSGTFFDDFDPPEGNFEEFLSRLPEVSIGSRLVESVFGKRQFVTFESRLFEFLEPEINAVIADRCNTGSVREDLLNEARQMVEDSLSAEAVNNKGNKLGMSVREWLRVGPDTRYSTDQMRQVVENMIQQRLLHLQRQCAVKHLLTIKDEKGNVTGGISDPTKRKMFQLYVRVFDLTNDWFTLSKQSWNTIFDEVLVNAPLMFLSAGAANLIVKAAVTGVSRLTRAAIVASRAYKASRTVGLLRNTVAALYRAHRAGSPILRALTGSGRVLRSLSEGALEGLFEQVLSVTTLEEIATGRSNRKGEDWVKAIATEAFAEGIFDFSGGLSSRIFQKTVAYKNIFGVTRYAQVSSWVTQTLQKFQGGKLAREFLEERFQELNSMATLMAFNYFTQASPNGQFSDSVAQSLMGDQSFQQNLLHVFLQVMSFSHGRKLASKLTQSTPALNAFFNGGHGDSGSTNPSRDLTRVNNDLAGVESNIQGLRNRADAATDPSVQQRLAELQEVRQGLLGQRSQLSLDRLNEIGTTLAEIDRTIAQEGAAFAESQGLFNRRLELMRERETLQKTFAEGTLQDYESALRSVSQQIQVLESIKSNMPAEEVAKIDAQIDQLRSILFTYSTAKNRFATQRIEHLRQQANDLANTIASWRSQGVDPGRLAELSAQEASLRTELRDLREQRTNVDTQAEYNRIVQEQTANGTLEATDAYGHVDLATGRWYVNRAKLRADADRLGAELRGAVEIRLRDGQLVYAFPQPGESLDALRDRIFATQIGLDFDAGRGQRIPRENIEAANVVAPQNAQVVAQRIAALDPPALGRMLALPADPVARQQAIDDLKNQLQNNPDAVDQARGADGSGSSLRDLLARNLQRNLLEGHVRHEMGHRFERSLDPATRDGLAQRLGYDLTNAEQRETFQESVADWLSGELPADRVGQIESFFRDQIKNQNPSFTDAQVATELTNLKKVSTIRETFNQNYQADVGVDFQRLGVVTGTIFGLDRNLFSTAKLQTSSLINAKESLKATNNPFLQNSLNLVRYLIKFTENGLDIHSVAPQNRNEFFKLVDDLITTVVGDPSSQAAPVLNFVSNFLGASLVNPGFSAQTSLARRQQLQSVFDRLSAQRENAAAFPQNIQNINVVLESIQRGEIVADTGTIKLLEIMRLKFQLESVNAASLVQLKSRVDQARQTHDNFLRQFFPELLTNFVSGRVKDARGKELVSVSERLNYLTTLFGFASNSANVTLAPVQQKALRDLAYAAKLQQSAINPEYARAILQNNVSNTILPDGSTATVYKAGYIASGTFGDVYRAFRFDRDGLLVEVVLKEFKRVDGASQYEIDFARHLFQLQSQGKLQKGIIRVDSLSGNGRSIAYEAVSTADQGVKSLDAYQFKDAREAVRFVVSLAKALQSLHNQGIQVNDFKPPNILVDENGEAVIIDIGSWWYGLQSTPLSSDQRQLSPLRDGGDVFIYTSTYAPPDTSFKFQEVSNGDTGAHGFDLYSLGKSLDALMDGFLDWNGERWNTGWDSNFVDVLANNPQLLQLFRDLSTALKGNAATNFESTLAFSEVIARLETAARQLDFGLNPAPSAAAFPEASAVEQDLLQLSAELEVPADRPAIFQKMGDYFRDRFSAFLKFRDAAADVEGTRSTVSDRSQSTIDAVNDLNAQNPTPETNPRRQVKVSDPVDYLEYVYRDLVNRGEIDESETTFDDFLSDEADNNRITLELAFVSLDGRIIFNLDGIQRYMEVTGRSFGSIARELITHENVHRTFNQLPVEIRERVKTEVSAYFDGLRNRQQPLTVEERKLLVELAKNLGVVVVPGQDPVVALFQRYPQADTALVDEMVATYFGLNRVGELSFNLSLETRLATAGIDVENFWKLSHARDAYPAGARYAYHDDATRRTEGGIVIEQPVSLDRGTVPPPPEAKAEVTARIDQATARLVDRLSQNSSPAVKALFYDTFVDPMTGLLNRGGLSFLDGMIRSGSRVSMLSFDGDHFGVFNSELSTAYGDFLIQVMGRNFHEMIEGLRQQFPNSGVEGVRMGGEEFVVFGNLPESAINQAMQDMSARLKQEIRSLLTPDQLEALAQAAYRAKYLDQGEAGLEKARQEIGGSTAGVLEYQFGAKDIPDPLKIRANALQYTDQFLEYGKNIGGRGQVYGNGLIQDRRTDNAERLFDFAPHNELGVGQNHRLTAGRSQLDLDVRLHFESHTPLRNQFLQDYGLNQVQTTIVDQFLRLPGFGRADFEVMARRIINRAGDNTNGRDLTTVINVLFSLKTEYAQAIRDFGSFTGAATTYHLNSLPSAEYSSPTRVDLGEFKSINETMGHTHGDTFLLFVYHRVLLDAARELGWSVEGPNPDIVIAQKGAGFIYRLNNRVAAEAGFFNGFIQSRYGQQVQQLFDFLGTDAEGRSYDQVRLQWLRENRQSADPSFPNQKQLLFTYPELPSIFDQGDSGDLDIDAERTRDFPFDAQQSQPLPTVPQSTPESGMEAAEGNAVSQRILENYKARIDQGDRAYLEQFFPELLQDFVSGPVLDAQGRELVMATEKRAYIQTLYEQFVSTPVFPLSAAQNTVLAALRADAQARGVSINAEYARAVLSGNTLQIQLPDGSTTTLYRAGYIASGVLGDVSRAFRIDSAGRVVELVVKDFKIINGASQYEIDFAKHLYGLQSRGLLAQGVIRVDGVSPEGTSVVYQAVRSRDQGIKTLEDYRFESPEAALRFFSSLVSAIRQIHDLGIIINDIKPANILVDANGNAVIIDIGSWFYEARSNLSEEAQRLAVNRDESLGPTPFQLSPLYAPPYLTTNLRVAFAASGEPGTHGFDLYSLGRSIEALLNGVLEHEGKSVQLNYEGHLGDLLSQRPDMRLLLEDIARKLQGTSFTLFEPEIDLAGVESLLTTALSTPVDLGRLEQARVRDNQSGGTVRQDQVRAENALLETMNTFEVPADRPGIFAAIGGFFRNAYQRFLKLRDRAQDLQETQSFTAAIDAEFSPLSTRLQDTVDIVEQQNAQEPTPETDRRGYIKVDNAIDYVESVYNDLVARGEINSDETTFDDFLEAEAEKNVVSLELAFVNRDGRIVFNQEGIQAYMQATGRSYTSVVRELLTHENVHRTFNQLSGEIRSAVIREVGAMYLGLKEKFDTDNLSFDERRLLTELAKQNIGVDLSSGDPIARLFEQHPVADTAVVDELVATYFGLNRVDELAVIPALDTALTAGGIDVSSFWKLSHARAAYPVGTRYAHHSDSTRRTQGGVVVSEANELRSVLARLKNQIQTNARLSPEFQAPSLRVLDVIGRYLSLSEGSVPPFLEYLSQQGDSSEFEDSFGVIRDFFTVLVDRAERDSNLLERRLLNAVSDFFQSVLPDLNPQVISMISSGRIRGLSQLKFLVQLIQSEQNSFRRGWYELQLLRLRMDLKPVNDVYRAETALRNLHEFPHGLFPELLPLANGNVSILDLKKPDGSAFTTIASLLEYVLPRLKIIHSPLLLNEADFDLYVRLSPELNEDPRTIPDLVAKREDLQAVLSRQLNVPVEDLLVILDAEEVLNVLEASGTVIGRFYPLDETDPTFGTSSGVAVLQGVVVQGMYSEGKFSAQSMPSSKLDSLSLLTMDQLAPQIGPLVNPVLAQLTPYQINQQKKAVLLNQLRQRPAGTVDDLIAAVESDVAIELPNGLRVYPGRQLGKGGIGAVFLGVFLDDFGNVVEVAVKKLLNPTRPGAKYSLRVAEHVSNTEMPEGVIRVYGVNTAQAVIVSQLVLSDQGPGIEAGDYQWVQNSPYQGDHFLKSYLRTLQSLHDRGVVVTDIKPANVLVQVVLDPQTKLPKTHPDGSVIVEPLVADVDTLVYKGLADDYPANDPRRELTFQRSGLRLVPFTPYTAPGNETYLSDDADGGRTMILAAPDTAYVIDAIPSKNNFEGIDAHAFGMTVLHLLMSNRFRYGQSDQTVRAFSLKGNFHEALPPDQRAKYLEAAEFAIGYTQAKAEPRDSDGYKLNGRFTSSLSDFSDRIYSQQNREILPAGQSFSYSVGLGSTVYIATSDARYVVRRDGAGAYSFEEVKTGVRQSKAWGTTAVFSGFEITFDQNGVRIRNTSERDIRVREDAETPSVIDSAQLSLHSVFERYISSLGWAELSHVMDRLEADQKASSPYSYLMGSILNRPSLSHQLSPDARSFLLQRRDEVSQRIFDSLLRDLLTAVFS
ncbi:MAG: hypothetical protein AB7J40_04105 [Candidatus Altimarinota bacterium]